MSNLLCGFFRFFLLPLSFVLATSILNPVVADSDSPDDRLAAANALFEEDDFTAAQDQYRALFEEGFYSEEMLYRMAFIYEKLENYPEAIYFLRKAAKEYGPKDTEEKVRGLLRSQRVTRMFSGGAWDQYFSFYRSWGWIVWTGFGLSALLLLGLILLPKERSFKGRTGATWSLALLAVVFTALVFHRTFLVPERAVIISETSYYSLPSYGAERTADALSPGETVFIEKNRDIWCRISAGRRSYWVPKMALREL